MRVVVPRGNLGHWVSFVLARPHWSWQRRLGAELPVPLPPELGIRGEAALEELALRQRRLVLSEFQRARRTAPMWSCVSV